MSNTNWDNNSQPIYNPNQPPPPSPIPPNFRQMVSWQELPPPTPPYIPYSNWNLNCNVPADSNLTPFNYQQAVPPRINQQFNQFYQDPNIQMQYYHWNMNYQQPTGQCPIQRPNFANRNQRNQGARNNINASANHNPAQKEQYSKNRGGQKSFRYKNDRQQYDKRDSNRNKSRYHPYGSQGSTSHSQSYNEKSKSLNKNNDKSKDSENAKETEPTTSTSKKDDLNDVEEIFSKTSKWVRCSPAELYYETKKDNSECTIGTEKLIELKKKFMDELIDRATRVKANKTPFNFPPRKVKIKSLKHSSEY